MDFIYKREHNTSFMITESEGTNLCTYEEKMLENNEISSLLEMSSMELNGKTEYRYTISKKESLKDYFDNEDITLELIQRALINIRIGLDELEDYLIEQRHLVLTENTIFFERTGAGLRAFFCYNSNQDEEVQLQLRHLIEWMLSVIPAGEMKLSETMAKIYDLCLKDDFTLTEIIECLGENIVTEGYEMTPEKETEFNPKQIKVEEVVLEDEEDLSSAFEDEPEKEGIFQIFDMLKEKFWEKKESKTFSKRKMEDFVVDPSEEIGEPTVMIRPEDIKCTGQLMYDGDYNEQNFIVTGASFKLGSSEKNDGILNSKTVSRHHAKISTENGKYFLEDLNSTNGTYLNGKPVAYRNPVKLKAMDRVQFGDVSYIFM